MDDTKKTNNKKINRCVFCGRSKADNKDFILFVKGKKDYDNPLICMICVSKYYKYFSKNLIRENSYKDFYKKNNSKFLPKNIKSYLDSYIIGQERAKKILSVAIYNHLKLLNHHKLDNVNDQYDKTVEIEKSNILLIGPTGSGKTAMIKRIAKYLNRPFAIGDATTYTSAGYIGADVEDVLKSLYFNSGNSVEAAEQGIVYIDEIDKTSRRNGVLCNSDPSHEGVQQALLKMVEGSKIEITVKGREYSPSSEKVIIDTTNILFIFGGSFEGIEEIIKRRMNKGKSRIGFGAEVENREKVAEFNDYILDITIEDLKKFGMLPELLGRIPIIAPMQELDKSALTDVLTVPKNSLIKQYKELMKMDNVYLHFTDKALDQIAKEAIRRKTGVRSLRGILENILTDLMFKFADNDNELDLVIDYKNDKFIYEVESTVKVCSPAIRK